MVRSSGKASSGQVGVFFSCHQLWLSAICYFLFVICHLSCASLAICYLLFVMRFAPSCASPSYSGNVLSETNTLVAFSGCLSVTPPKKMPRIEMLPPLRPVPPMMATAKLPISQVSPVSGAAEPIIDVQRTAAKPARTPEMTWAQRTIRSVAMPHKRAAFSFPP